MGNEVTRRGPAPSQAVAISWRALEASLCGVALRGKLLVWGSAAAASRSCWGSWGFGLAAVGTSFLGSGAAYDTAALTSILCHRRCSHRGD